MTASFPFRPRLADHALPRRHVIDGIEHVMLHDARTGELYKLSPRDWAIARHADGTRDVDGICLAASRQGVYRRASEVRRLLEQLHAWELLADGIAPPLPAVETWSDRPLDPLPSFFLTCNGGGACCATYATVLFSADEAERARVTVPRPLPVVPDDRLFLPAQGDPARRPDSLAITLVDGRCAYLDAAGSCRLHAAGGAQAKPFACRAYPATFVDDGEAIRVSVGVECTCVLGSVGAREGEPIVPPGVTTMAGLPVQPRVLRLPERVRVHAGVFAARKDVIDWSRALAACSPPPADVLAACWRLADTISAAGLAIEGSLSAWTASPAAPPSPEALAPWLSALSDRATARLEAAQTWRSARDRVRLAAGWIASASRALANDPARVSRALQRAQAHAASEAFYLRAALHGHHLIEADRGAPSATRPEPRGSIARALRDRALRLLLARELPNHVTGDDSARQHPLALVEAMMRAQGLGAYVDRVLDHDDRQATEKGPAPSGP